MPKVGIIVPEHPGTQIVQLVEQGKFANRDEAIGDLLLISIRIYKTSDPISGRDRAYEDDGVMGHEDGYVFRAG